MVTSTDSTTRVTEITSLLSTTRDSYVQPVDQSNAVLPVDGCEEDREDIERQVSNGDAHKHQGLPEVMKSMKFIFPAIAIGVSHFHSVFSPNWRTLANLHRSSYPQPIKPSS